MFKSRRNMSQNNGPLSPGWLFADLLLVLTILFLATNVIIKKPSPPVIAIATGTPTLGPTPTDTPIPTDTPLPSLDNHAQLYTLPPVDFQGLLNDDPTAIANTQTAILNIIPQNKRAGLIIVYVGYQGSQQSTSRDVGMKIGTILTAMGKTTMTFDGTAIHDPIGLTGDPLSFVQLEVYFFK